MYSLALMQGRDSENDISFILMALPALDQEYLKNFYEEDAKKKKAAANKAKRTSTR